jgi:hypothetical protein
LLIDFLGNFVRSAKEGLPIYRIENGPEAGGCHFRPFLRLVEKRNFCAGEPVKIVSDSAIVQMRQRDLELLRPRSAAATITFVGIGTGSDGALAARCGPAGPDLGGRWSSRLASA